MHFGGHVYAQTFPVDQSGTFRDTATKKMRHDQIQLTPITIYFGRCSQQVPYHLDCNIFNRKKPGWCAFLSVFVRAQS